MTGLPDADVAPATRRIVELVRRVPVEYRDFNRTAADAVVLHRISGPLLCDLVAAGLPHVGRGENALFDDRDLANVSASLALRSAWFLGQRGWARVLQRLDAGVAATYEIRVRPRCRFPGHRQECRFDLWLGETRSATGHAGAATGVLTAPDTIVVTSGTETVIAPPEVTEVLACLDGVGYFHLPEALEWDLGFFHRTRLANCTLATAAVAERAGRLRVRVRTSFGLIVVPPFAGPHSWAEFFVGGRWVAFDPHLVRFLEKAGVLRPGQWCPEVSIGGLLLRLGAGMTSLARHGGLHAEVSCPVKEIPNAVAGLQR